MYRWLKKNNYPAGFQVLCANLIGLKFMKMRKIKVNLES